MSALPADAKDLDFAVVVSATAEWQVVKPLFETEAVSASPYGESNLGPERVLVFQGGWGKVAAAGSTQYVIDHFNPARLINVGTCGGVEGRIQRFDIVAVQNVIIYDIEEAIGDSKRRNC
jgi:adenosylhomocysteine nucleosidase